jgi:ribosomal protein S18 acetylase RimI-like enzyme
MSPPGVEGPDDAAAPARAEAAPASAERGAIAIRALIAGGEPAALLAQLGELVVRAYDATGALDRDDDHAPTLRDVDRRARDAVVLAAFAAADPAAAPLGCVTYVPDRASPLAERLDDGEASIRMLAVAPAAQGRGVGAALVAACLARARAAGRAAVFLHSLPVMAAARRLYLRAGFQPVPARDWHVAGLQLMAFRLPL